MKAKRIIGIASDALFPPRCPFCDGLLKKDEPLLCRNCAKEFSFLRSRTCMRCGKVLHSLFEEECSECASMPHEFTEALAPFSYSGEVRESLARFKYQRRAEYARFYAVCIWRFGRERIGKWRPQLMVPVPIHRSRYAQRGYNQAELIAAELSKLSGIPMDPNLIRRTKKTVAQKELGRMERRRNMEEAFACGTDRPLPERILLVDDILTTGSTADAIAHVLRQRGAKEVFVVCAAVS